MTQEPSGPSLPDPEAKAGFTPAGATGVWGAGPVTAPQLELEVQPDAETDDARVEERDQFLVAIVDRQDRIRGR